ncbi:MAG: SCO family protein [Pseudomonadota bacterium]
MDRASSHRHGSIATHANPSPVSRLSLHTSLFVLIAALVFCFGSVIGAKAAVDVKERATAKPLTPFTLIDGDGQTFDKSRLEGRWSLVVLGFTHCPDVCPFTLQNLAQVREELTIRVSPARVPQIVFIGVDPDRDAKLIGGYVKHFGDDFIGATGEWSEIEKTVEALEGYVRINRKGKAKDDNDYPVFHSAVISVVDPKGQLVAGVNPPMDPSETAIYLASLMLKHSRASASN